MKVIDIKKHYRNGVKQHYIVLYDNSYSDDDINDLVEEWCENEPCGLNHGYTYDWWYVDNAEIIKEVLENKKIILDIKIESLNRLKNKIEIEQMRLIYDQKA